MEIEKTFPELIKDALNINPATEQASVEYKELNAELLGEYHRVQQRLKALEEIKGMLHANILKLAKDQRGAIPRGEYTLLLKPRKGNVTVDWAGYVEDQIGPLATKELDDLKQLVKAGKAESVWIKQGKETLTVEVVKGEVTPEY